MKLAPFAFKRHAGRYQSAGEIRRPRSAQADEDVVGKRLLASPDLVTDFCIITKRIGYRQSVDQFPTIRAPHIGRTARLYRQQALSVGQSGARQHSGAAFLRSGAASDPAHRNASGRVGQAAYQPWLARVFNALLQKIGLRKRVKIDPNNYGLFVDGGVTRTTIRRWRCSIWRR